MADWDHIQSLMRAVADGGDAGWHDLLTALEPELIRFARRQPIGRLRELEDSPREIITRVVARLHANEFSALRKMFADDPPPHPRAWIRVLVRRSAIDYMREQPEFFRGSSRDGPRWVTLVSLVTGEGIRDPDTLAEKRRQLITFVTAAVERTAELYAEVGEAAFDQLAIEWSVARIHVRRLVKKGKQLLDVLSSVLEGLSHTEVGSRLSLSRREVQLSVQYIEELLEARQFGVSK